MDRQLQQQAYLNAIGQIQQKVMDEAWRGMLGQSKGENAMTKEQATERMYVRSDYLDAEILEVWSPKKRRDLSYAAAALVEAANWAISKAEEGEALAKEEAEKTREMARVERQRLEAKIETLETRLDELRFILAAQLPWEERPAAFKEIGANTISIGCITSAKSYFK